MDDTGVGVRQVLATLHVRELPARAAVSWEGTGVEEVERGSGHRETIYYHLL